MPPKGNHSSQKSLVSLRNLSLPGGLPVRAEAARSSVPPLLAPSGLGPLMATAHAQQDEQSTGSLWRPRLGTESKSHAWAPRRRGEHRLLELERQVSEQESDLAARSNSSFGKPDLVGAICLLVLYLSWFYTQSGKTGPFIWCCQQ